MQEDMSPFLRLLEGSPNLPVFCFHKAVLGDSHQCSCSVHPADEECQCPAQETPSKIQERGADSLTSIKEGGKLVSDDRECESLPLLSSCKDMKYILSSTPLRKMSTPHHLALDSDNEGEWSISMATPSCQPGEKRVTPYPLILNESTTTTETSVSTMDDSLLGLIDSPHNNQLMSYEKIKSKVMMKGKKPLARALFPTEKSPTTASGSMKWAGPDLVNTPVFQRQRAVPSKGLQSRFEQCLVSPIPASPLVSKSQSCKPESVTTFTPLERSIAYTDPLAILNTSFAASPACHEHVENRVGLVADSDRGKENETSCSQELFGSPEMFSVLLANEDIPRLKQEREKEAYSDRTTEKVISDAEPVNERSDQTGIIPVPLTFCSDFQSESHASTTFEARPLSEGTVSDAQNLAQQVGSGKKELVQRSESQGRPVEQSIYHNPSDVFDMLFMSSSQLDVHVASCHASSTCTAPACLESHAGPSQSQTTSRPQPEDHETIPEVSQHSTPEEHLNHLVLPSPTTSSVPPTIAYSMSSTSSTCSITCTQSGSNFQSTKLAAAMVNSAINSDIQSHDINKPHDDTPFSMPRSPSRSPPAAKRRKLSTKGFRYPSKMVKKRVSSKLPVSQPSVELSHSRPHTSRKVSLNLSSPEVTPPTANTLGASKPTEDKKVCVESPTAKRPCLDTEVTLDYERSESFKMSLPEITTSEGRSLSKQSRQDVACIGVVSLDTTNSKAPHSDKDQDGHESNVGKLSRHSATVVASVTNCSALTSTEVVSSGTSNTKSAELASQTTTGLDQKVENAIVTNCKENLVLSEVSSIVRLQIEGVSRAPGLKMSAKEVKSPEASSGTPVPEAAVVNPSTSAKTEPCSDSQSSTNEYRVEPPSLSLPVFSTSLTPCSKVIPFTGFKTASGRSVDISDRALERARRIIGEEDTFPVEKLTLKVEESFLPILKQEATCQSTLFTSTVSDTSAPKGASPSVSSDSVSSVSAIAKSMSLTPSSFTEFKTPNPLSSKAPSRHSLTIPRRTISTKRKPVKAFKAPRKAGSVSKEEEQASLARIMKNFRASSEPKDGKDYHQKQESVDHGQPSTRVESGFSTAGGKKLSFSMSAMQQAQTILTQEKDRTINEVRPPLALPDVSVTPLSSSSSLFLSTGFQTGSGRTLKVSVAAMEHAHKIVDRVESESLESPSELQGNMGIGFKSVSGISQSMSSGSPKVTDTQLGGFVAHQGSTTFLTGFQTAKGSSISVSAKSLKRAQGLVAEDQQYQEGEVVITKGPSVCEVMAQESSLHDVCGIGEHGADILPSPTTGFYSSAGKQLSRSGESPHGARGSEHVTAECQYQSPQVQNTSSTSNQIKSVHGESECSDSESMSLDCKRNVDVVTEAPSPKQELTVDPMDMSAFIREVELSHLSTVIPAQDEMGDLTSIDIENFSAFTQIHFSTPGGKSACQEDDIENESDVCSNAEIHDTQLTPHQVESSPVAENKSVMDYDSQSQEQEGTSDFTEDTVSNSQVSVSEKQPSVPEGEAETLVSKSQNILNGEEQLYQGMDHSFLSTQVIKQFLEFSTDEREEQNNGEATILADDDPAGDAELSGAWDQVTCTGNVDEHPTSSPAISDQSIPTEDKTCSESKSFAPQQFCIPLNSSSPSPSHSAPAVTEGTNLFGSTKPTAPASENEDHNVGSDINTANDVDDSGQIESAQIDAVTRDLQVSLLSETDFTTAANSFTESVSPIGAPPTCFVGLQTASGKAVHIPKQSLEAAKRTIGSHYDIPMRMRENILLKDSDKSPTVPQTDNFTISPSSSSSFLPTLQTASGKTVSVSESSLRAVQGSSNSKNVPQHRPSLSRSKSCTYPGLQTASGKTVSVSKASLNAARRTLEGEQSSGRSISLGLQTASGRSVEISESSLHAARRAIRGNEGSNTTMSSASFPGLQTAGGRAVEISDTSLQAVRRTLHGVNPVAASQSVHTEGASISGLSTASGHRAVSPRESRSTVSTPGGERSSSNRTIGDEKEGTPQKVPSVSISAFSTAGGKTVQVSRSALRAVKRILHSDAEVNSSDGHQPQGADCYASSQSLVSTVGSPMVGIASKTHARISQPSFCTPFANPPTSTPTTQCSHSSSAAVAMTRESASEANSSGRYRPVFKSGTVKPTESDQTSGKKGSVCQVLDQVPRTPPQQQLTRGITSNPEAILADRSSQRLFMPMQSYLNANGSYITSTPVQRYPLRSRSSVNKATSSRVGLYKSVAQKISVSSESISRPEICQSSSSVTPSFSDHRSSFVSQSISGTSLSSGTKTPFATPRRQLYTYSKSKGKSSYTPLWNRSARRTSDMGSATFQPPKSSCLPLQPTQLDSLSDSSTIHSTSPIRKYSVAASASPITSLPPKQPSSTTVKNTQTSDVSRVACIETEVMEPPVASPPSPIDITLSQVRALECSQTQVTEKAEASNLPVADSGYQTRTQAGINSSNTGHTDSTSSLHGSATLLEPVLDSASCAAFLEAAQESLDDSLDDADDPVEDQISMEVQSSTKNCSLNLEAHQAKRSVQHNTVLPAPHSNKPIKLPVATDSNSASSSICIGGLLSIKLQHADHQVALVSVVDCQLPGKFTAGELFSLGVNPSVVGVSAANAACFRFAGPNFFSPVVLSGAPVRIGDGALLKLEGGSAGVNQFWEAFLQSPGVDSKLISLEWFHNHYRYIVWKLAAFEVAFPRVFAGRSLTPDRLMLQLKYRYDREIDRAERPAIRKICEHDDIPSRTMVLCVSAIYTSEVVRNKDVGNESTNESKKESKSEEQALSPCMELSDGWYSLPVVVDTPLKHMVRVGKISVGVKLMVYGAELVGGSGPCHPLEAPSNLALKISANSTRRARWFAKLGYQPSPKPFKVPLASVYPDGGLVGCAEVCVARVYPLLYMEKRTEGRTVFRNARTEEKVAAIFEAERQRKIETICSRVQREFEREVDHQEYKLSRRRSRRLNTLQIKQLQDGAEIHSALANAADPVAFQELLSRTQSALLESYLQSIQSQRQAELQSRIEQAMKDAEDDLPPARSTVPLLRICVVPLTCSSSPLHCLLTIWRPGEEVIGLMEEGKGLRVYNLTSATGRYRQSASLQLTATRSTRYEPSTLNSVGFPPSYVPRQCLSIGSLGMDGCRVPYDEFDVVGIVVCTTTDNVPLGDGSTCILDTVYLSDAESHLLAIKIWEGLEFLGIADLVTPSALIAVSNLSYHRLGPTHHLPQARANESCIFSQNPRDNHLKLALQKLKEELPEDKATFLQSLEKRIPNLDF